MAHKLHIGIDAEVLQIRTVQLTKNDASNSQVLADLLARLPLDEQIDSIHTNSAYDTKHCRQVILNRYVHVIITSRKNVKPWKNQKLRSLERKELLKTVKNLGRILWKKWTGYHHRGLVETKMLCIKLLSYKLTVMSFPNPVNEIHTHIAVLNKFTKLGYPHTQIIN